MVVFFSLTESSSRSDGNEEEALAAPPATWRLCRPVRLLLLLLRLLLLGLPPLPLPLPLEPFVGRSMGVVSAPRACAGELRSRRLGLAVETGGGGGAVIGGSSSISDGGEGAGARGGCPRRAEDGGGGGGKRAIARAAEGLAGGLAGASSSLVSSSSSELPFAPPPPAFASSSEPWLPSLSGSERWSSAASERSASEFSSSESDSDESLVVRRGGCGIVGPKRCGCSEKTWTIAFPSNPRVNYRSLLGSYLLPVGTLLGSAARGHPGRRAEAKTRRGGLMPGPLSARRVS